MTAMSGLSAEVLARYAPHGVDNIWGVYRAELEARGCTSPLVVIHGGYGKHNLGDDAILDVLLSELRTTIPAARFVVLCHGPAEVQRRHDVEAHHFASRGALRAILTADVYVIGGGGIVNKINVYSGFRRFPILDPKGKFLFVAALVAGLRGARVVFHAIGATSVPDPLVGWLAKLAMGRADSVSVRDPLSGQVLRRLGVRRDVPVVNDPALALEPVAPEMARQLLRGEGVELGRPVVGLNFRYVAEEGVDNARTVETVARLVDWLIEECGAEVIFLPFGRHPHKPVENDEGFAGQVGKRLHYPERYRILRREPTPAEMKAIVGQMTLCIFERLHATILAASMGVPLLGVAYDNKVTQFMKMAELSEAVIALKDFDFEAVRARLLRLPGWSLVRGADG